jgi:hypothetical protein
MPPRTKSFLDGGIDYPDHPLFPVEEGEANPQVTYIQITRHDRGVQKYGPTLKGEELTTTEELFEMYGGGHYELWARGPSKMKPDSPGNITRKRRFVLPGRSKPLSKDPTPEELREADMSAGAAAAAPIAAPSSSGGAGGFGDNVLIAMMNMQAEASRAAMAAQQKSSEQFMMMMLQVMTSSKTDSSELAKMMMQMSQQQSQTLLTLMTAGREGGTESLAKTVKTLRDLGLVQSPKESASGDGGGEGGLGKMIEDAADFVQGIAQLRTALPPAAGANGMPENGAAAPPGSAAAVAEAMLPKV